MGESKERECLWFPFTTLPVVFGGEPAEFNEPGFALFERQSKATHTPLQMFVVHFRIRLILTCELKVLAVSML